MNVKHRRCAENGCNTRPAFNWKGEEKGAYCNKHKEKGMVNVDKKEARAGRPLATPPPSGTATQDALLMRPSHACSLISERLHHSSRHC